MKRFLALFIAIICLFAFSGCGNTFGAKKTVSDSEIFRMNEIEKAMNIVTRYFAFHFEGCVLLELEYDEDYSKERAKEWAKQYDADEAIVLLSSFYVEKQGNGSLEGDKLYKNYNWILVKNKGESWRLKTWGYG